MGREALGGIQFYLQNLQDSAIHNLGLRGGRGTLAFPNLDPRSATVEAGAAKGKRAGQIGKMTDNVVLASLEDVEKFKDIISGPAGPALASYSEGFEKIKRAQLALKKIPQTDEVARNKALDRRFSIEIPK